MKERKQESKKEKKERKKKRKKEQTMYESMKESLGVSHRLLDRYGHSTMLTTGETGGNHPPKQNVKDVWVPKREWMRFQLLGYIYIIIYIQPIIPYIYVIIFVVIFHI